MAWFSSIEHHRWLSLQMNGLLAYGRAAQVPAGFGFLNHDGEVDEAKPAELYLTARMTHVYSLGTLMGIPGCRRYADHGVRSLRKYFADPEFGGWYDAIELAPSEAGQGVPVADRKMAYSHAFVLLAAASATAANRPGANELFDDAMRISERYFWEQPRGMVRESYDRTFSKSEPYRGINANMHTVEAYLAAADVSADLRWLDRALEIIEFVHREAAKTSWRIAEHYSAEWQVDLRYNEDDKAHPFRPYGATPGHGLEWSRLVVETWAACQAAGRTPPEWMLEMATELFERARVDAWRRDGAAGFVYTTDFDGKAVVRTRMHWVVCEGIQAAVALRQAQLDSEVPDIGAIEHYEHCYRSWVDYAEEYLIRQPGQWHHELAPDNTPSATVWDGTPDIYHAMGAMLAQRLPLAPCAGMALSDGLLDRPDGTGRKPDAKKKHFLFW